MSFLLVVDTGETGGAMQDGNIFEEDLERSPPLHSVDPSDD